MSADPLSEAGGPVPRPLTTADVLAMVRGGTMAADERVELVDGELLRMSPKNRRHELVKDWLIERAGDLRANAYKVSVEGTLYLSDTTFVEPDIALIPRGTVITELDGTDVLLVIEVSDTTRRHDLVAKRRKYAQHGIRDYWVVDVTRERTVVHREPHGEDYTQVVEVNDADLLTALLAPAFSVRIGDAVA